MSAGGVCHYCHKSNCICPDRPSARGGEMSDHKELRDLVRCGIHPKVGTVQILLNDYDQLRRQCDELAGVLAFYADTCSYMWWLKDERTKDTRKVLLDAGKLAREALAKYREAK